MDSEAVDILPNNEIHEELFVCIENIGLHYNILLFFLKISCNVLEVQYIKMKKGSLIYPLG